MNNISLDNAYLLLIAVPLILLFAIPFVIAVRKENRNAHNVASLIIHVVMALVIAFAAAGPSFTTILTETDVYVVADVSYSAKRNLDTIDRYIKNLDLPDNSKLGLVCFGKDYQLVSRLGDPKNVKSVKKATVDDTETNIAEALTYTGTLFGTNAITRIVLITDGKQSDLSDTNAIRRAVDGLETQNIRVDAIFLDNNPSTDSREVQISGVDYTETVYLDSKQQAVVEVQSSYNTAAVLTLIRDGIILSDEDVTLEIGLNNVEIELDTSAAGTFRYEVQISAKNDSNLNNNTYSFTQTVSDEMNVLVITQSFDDCMAAVRRYGEKGAVDVYENDTEYVPTTKRLFASRYEKNDSINIHLDTVDVPYTIEDLCKYDEIVLADLDISTLNNYTAFINNLDDAVAVFGKSLITFGNLHIQNAQDAELKQLGDMLPVNFGNTDSKLYSIIIDTSRSMMQLDHLNITKQLVTRLVNALNDDTYITIITFNSDAQVIQPVTPIANRGEILEKVAKFEVIQGTVLGSGLRRSLEYMQPLSFDDKQVLLITDGLSYSGDVLDKPDAVAAEMFANGIVTSVFDVGRQGDKVNGGNDWPSYQEAFNLLTKVAEEGHGKHYYSRNLERLDEVTFGEMTDDMTVTVVEREATVSVQRLQQNDPVLDGIDDILSIPNVNGYVYCGSKPSATTVLSVNHKRSADSVYTVEKPLYAYQNYGEGKVSSFTSSLGGSWVSKWESSVGSLFFGNVFDLSVPEEKHSTPYSVNVIREGKTTRIELQPTTLRTEATATIEITLPNGSTVSEAMTYSGSLYHIEFATDEVGKYGLKITYTYKQEYSCEKDIYVCYLDEYDAFDVFEPSALHRAIDGRGTVSEDGNLKIENNDNDVGKYVIELAAPLLIAVAALFVIDVAVRKLKIEDIKSFLGIGKKKKEVEK